MTATYYFIIKDIFASRENPGGLTMKIERINENKIKVMIDNEEAKEWNITLNNISKNTPEVQKMFWRAIGMAKESVDFTVDGARLFVETMPALESGIGMMITKVSNDSELKTAVENCGYKGKISNSELKAQAGNRLAVCRRIYKFNTFEDVCSAAGELKNIFVGKSSLYKMEDAYYLYMVTSDPLSVCETEIVLSEFAAKVANSQYVHGRLSEYGSMMIEDNTLEVVNQYFG